MPSDSRTRSKLVMRVRAALFAALGPECAGCGCDLRGVAWEVNHIYGRTWTPRKTSSYQRNRRYWHEAQLGLVNLMCRECNLVYRPKPLPPPLTLSNHPF